MMSIYQKIKNSSQASDKLLAILIDPDKVIPGTLKTLIDRIHKSTTSLILVGGSQVENGVTDSVIRKIKALSDLPVAIFPGDINQISPSADAILLLSLVSGRNPEYLIGKHVEAVPLLDKSGLEIISTAYILIENGKQTAVERYSGTQPMPRADSMKIINTAKAAEYLGFKMVYLEAGSGAGKPISAELIKKVRTAVDLPIIVGGGIRSTEDVHRAYRAGANMVVIGTAVEQDNTILNTL